MTLSSQKALIVIDVQNDFVTGSLAIPGAKDIIPIINEKITLFNDTGCLVLATKDWHPRNHCSFKIWTPHCIVGTDGARFYSGLITNYFLETFFKGMDLNKDNYSGFGNNPKESYLHDFLQKMGITDIYLCGFTAEFCVANTAFDAKDLGYSVYVLKNAIAAVNEKTGKFCLDKMTQRGINII